MELTSSVDNTSISSELMKNKLSTLSSLQANGSKNLSDSEKADLAKAARGFESIFINMMLKEMKAGMLDEEKKGDGGFGADTLKGYMDMQLSDQISKTGTGIGIADMIYSQLSGGGKLTNVTQQQPTQIFDQLKNIIQQNSESESDSGDEVSSTDDFSSLINNFQGKVSDRLDKYQSIISEASSTYGVPEELIKGIITAESAGKSDAKSAAGAKGLMQLMDGTAKSLGVNNSFDPKENIMGGTKYIKQMLDTFGSTDKALAAYNAGPGNVKKYDGIPPFKETQSYVQKVTKYAESYKV